MARFNEVFRCAGVDEEAEPPAMIVPFGGSNLVVLSDGQGLRVDSVNKAIRIEEIADSISILRQQIALNNALAQPDVDGQRRAAFMPEVLFGRHPRFFRIHGKTLLGPPGLLVQAKSARKVEAQLRVVVLDKKSVQLSIRNVQVPDASGAVVFHAKKPCDPQQECDGMNAVYIPQTLMAFELISSNPVLVDDREKSLREELAKEYGLKEKEASFPEIVNPGKVKKIFIRLKDNNADFTIFVVHRLQTTASQPDGVTMPQYGIAFITGSHGPTTFAHEAGHFLGGQMHVDGWHALDHTKKDERMLMQDGGGSWKIPFDIAMKFRTFFVRHPSVLAK